MNRILPWEYNLRRIENITPSLRYDGVSDFLEWQRVARQKLSELLGMDRIEKPENPEFIVEYIKECDSHTEYRFLVESEPEYFVPCYMLVPNEIKTPAPTMLCLQGHSTGMHISIGKPIYEGDEGDINGGDRDFARRAIKEGCVAVAIEQRNFGECGAKPDGNPNCHVSSMSAIISGRTTIGERVHDTSCVIDALLSNFDFVDKDRIMLMGNSGGGTATVYTAAIDERISLAVPSCAVCTYKHSIAAMKHCVCNFVPNIVDYFDMGELCGLIAPRGLVVVNGRLDKIFPDAGVREVYAETERLYAAAGASDNCYLVTGEEGHRFYADIAWPKIHTLMDKI